MHIPIVGWGILVVALWVTNFGLWWTFVAILSWLVFILAGTLYMYSQNVENTRAWQQQFTSESSNCGVIRPGLRRILEDISQSKTLPKCDKRLTGSGCIDESLHEIIGYVIRDYVYPWYDRLSEDDAFSYHIRDSAQKTIVNIAARMKEVDWIPYLTTQLVDDAASHLRLYRQACAKTKQRQKELQELKQQKSLNDISKPQTLASFKNTTEQNATTELKNCHSRNPSGSNIQVVSPTGHSRNNSNSGITAGTVKSSADITQKSTPTFKSFISEPDPIGTDIENVFFDLELAMEKHLLCRDLVCTDKDQEKRFLQDLVDVLLFLLLPPNDFHCLSLRLLLRDLIIGGVLLPLFNLLTDPDYINLSIIWLCRDVPLTPEAFLLTLRISDNLDELHATRDLVSREISFLRSRDSGGDDDAIVKQQLSSLLYVRKVLDNRLGRLQEGFDNDSSGVSADCSLTPGFKVVTLSLDVILKNNVALSYFIDYMTTVSHQHYLFFYLNIEGWKTSVEQLTFDLNSPKLGRTNRNSPRSGSPQSAHSTSSSTADNMREAALSIYNQYLSDKASIKIKFEEPLVANLLERINNDAVSESWFDEIQASIYCKLQTHEKFLPGFHRSSNYIKLLSELELLKDSTLADDDDDDYSHSLDNLSLSDNTSLFSLENGDLNDQASNPDDMQSNASKTKEPEVTHGEGKFTLAAEIIDTGVVQDRGKTYGIYALFVSKSFNNGFIEKWHVYRRYSDFYDLQQRVKETYSNLGKLTFPGKKTFHNMERATLEKRMKMLNDYLQILLQSSGSDTYSKLPNMLLTFLEPGEYDKSSGPFVKTFDTLVNPLKSSMRTVGQAVRTMPDNLLNTVDEVFDGITKVFQTRSKEYDDPMRVGSFLHQETDENIPLRIMLLLMDEVFDLKSRNQWLRKRIVTLLRQIIRTMFGDIVNKKILDYVKLLTCPEQVASYLNMFKQSMWPNGSRGVPPATRDEPTRMRTRVMAKTALLSSLSDELKHIIGSDTTRRGLMRVFHLFQHPVLNRRLLYVLIEGLLETSFPQHNLTEIFRKMHSRSPRVREDSKVNNK